MKSTNGWAALTSILFLASFQIPQAMPVRDCRIVGGIPSIGTTEDDGVTWGTSHRPMRPGEGSFGLAVVRDSGQLLTEYQGKVYVSDNGGCAWHPIGTVEDSPLLLAGSGSGGYAWNLFSARDVWRIDLEATGNGRVVLVTNLAENVIALGVEPLDDLHVRAVGAAGGLYDSSDGGASWNFLGAAPTTPIVYFAAFDPQDIDHVVVGMVLNGVVTTFDAGASWSFASGLSQTDGSRNSFSGVVSEAEPSVVWVESIDLDEFSGGAPSQGKHIYRSRDGGLSFTSVVDAGGDVVLVNGAALAAPRSNPDVVYFPYGSSVFGSFIRLYRYDHATGQLTWTTTTTVPHTKARAMVFSAQQPERLVVGFEGS